MRAVGRADVPHDIPEIIGSINIGKASTLVIAQADALFGRVQTGAIE
jgi:hypothetical protein